MYRAFSVKHILILPLILAVALATMAVQAAPTAGALYASLNVPGKVSSSQQVASSGALGSVNSIDAKREAYQQAKTAIKNGDLAYAQHLRDTVLKDYPLTVWIDYYLLSEDKSAAKFDGVMQFINSGRQHELAELLRTRYIDFFAQERDFAKVYALIGSKPETGSYDSLNFRQKSKLCRFYEAAWQIGKGSDEAVAFAGQLYLDLDGVPRACDGLIALYDAKGYLTDRLKLEKFARAYTARFEGNLTKRLAEELSYSKYAQKVQVQMEFYDDPERIFEYPLNTRADKRIAALAFARYANLNPRDAAAQLDAFFKVAQPSESEQVDIIKVIAKRFLERGRSLEEVSWVDKHLPAIGWTPDIKEQRLRRAIYFAQWEIAYQLLNHVAPDFAAEINWRYWKGRSALETGRTDEGQEILQEVATDRSFFGFLAAQQLGIQPSYRQLRLSAGAKWPADVNGDPAVTRFFELYAMDDANAIYEWREIAKYSKEQTALLMAEWALRNGNTRLAIDSVVSSKRWDALSYRFPIVYPEIYKLNAAAQNVSLSFMYGVSRQESMLNPVIRSPVGAVGLMQLMPATAKMVSRQNKWDYGGVQSLTDPAVNVRLGAAYLRDMLDKFGNNRILAAAAYNAGPGRIYRWESKDGFKRDVAMYVENIPFSETRKYVQNVLLYDAIYHKILTGQEQHLLTDAELSFNY